MENILSGQNYTGGMVPIEVVWRETHMREQAKMLEKNVKESFKIKKVVPRRKTK